MFKTFEKFLSNIYVEWTPENPNKRVFSNLDGNHKKWLDIYIAQKLINKIRRYENHVQIWTSYDKNPLELPLKDSSHRDHNNRLIKKLIFVDRYHWDEGLQSKYKDIKKKQVELISDADTFLMSHPKYIRLIDLGLDDTSTPKQRQNGTFEFKSQRTYKSTFGKDILNVTYHAYARGVATVKQGHVAMTIGKPLKINSYKDYFPLFDYIYEYESKKLANNENKEGEIPADLLKFFSQEDQLTYALDQHPDHDLWIFVGRPAYKDVIVNNKKYKEETLEIETLVKIENGEDAKQAHMMKIRAVHQGENSRLYSVWLPKETFDADKKYVYGSEVPDWMMPLIDEHKQKA